MSDQVIPTVGLAFMIIAFIYTILAIVETDVVGLAISVGLFLVGLWFFTHPKPWNYRAEERVKAIQEWEAAGCPDPDEYLKGKRG